MARTTPSAVKNTFDTDLSDSAVSDWIAVAGDTVDDIAAEDSTISSGRLERIEKLLAQGHAAAQDPRIESTSRETASVSYQRNENYPNDYFALAAALDPTGTVASMFKPNAGVFIPDSKGIND